MARALSTARARTHARPASAPHPQRELLPVVQSAYDDLLALTRSELSELVRELKLLDGLAFAGLSSMRLGQGVDASTGISLGQGVDASRLIESLDFHRSLASAHRGVAVGGGLALVGGGFLLKACVVGVGGLAGVLSLAGVGGMLICCLGGAIGSYHANTLSHLQNSAAEIQLQAALEMKVRARHRGRGHGRRGATGDAGASVGQGSRGRAHGPRELAVGPARSCLAPLGPSAARRRRGRGASHALLSARQPPFAPCRTPPLLLTLVAPLGKPRPPISSSPEPSPPHPRPALRTHRPRT
jgi:hypothetical protein